MGPPTDAPTRAKVGWVLKHARVKQGKIDPGLIVGILAHHDAIDDPEEAREVAEEVLEHRGRLDDA